MRKRLIPVVFIALLLAVGALVYRGQWRERSAELYYSGTIEATEANIAFQVPGRVAEVAVDEGQKVAGGQLLAVLAREEYAALRRQAAAEVAVAQRGAEQLEARLALERTLLPAEVERAQAALEALEAQAALAESGYRAEEVRQGRLAMEEARAALENARKEKARVDALFQRGVVAEREKDAADLRYETALKNYRRRQQAYRLLQEGFRGEEVAAARARLAEGRAALKQATENLKRIELTEHEVAAARARVAAAEAALALADIRLARCELKAPFDGIVVSRNLEPGEVVTAGQEVVAVADLSSVELKVWVDETEIGNVKPGQPVEVRIDTFPEKVYAGRVGFVSPEGEFTPKFIQTRKERVKLVYLVKIVIPNPELELKTGMPADAWFR